MFFNQNAFTFYTCNSSQGYRVDLLAFSIDIAIAVLCIVIAKIGFDVGKRTGNISWWSAFTIGWALISAGRVTIAVVNDAELIYAPNFKYVGMLTIVIALFLVLYGMYKFSENIMEQDKKHHVR